MPSHPRACKVHFDGLARIQGDPFLRQTHRPTLSGALEAPLAADLSSMMVWLGHGPPGLPGGGYGYGGLVRV